MNALEIIGNYVESEENYELQLKNQEEDTSGREVGNIRTEQIRTGEGIFAEGMKPMNAELADRLNQYPNPERNGLILYFAEKLLEIVGREDSKYMTILRFLHGIPPGWKAELPKQRPEKEFGTNSEKESGPVSEGVEGFGAFDQAEYEQVRRFISETMVSGIKKFKEKHSSQDFIHFQNLALNLLAAGREIKTALL